MSYNSILHRLIDKTPEEQAAELVKLPSNLADSLRQDLYEQSPHSAVALNQALLALGYDLDR